MSDSIRGLSTAEAAVWAQSMTNARSGLPGEVVFGREHCAGLAAQALLNAIQRYSDARREEWNGEDALICSCFGVSQHEIELKIREGHLETIEAVTAHCKAGGGCNSCYPLIQDILDQAADRL